MMIVCQHHNQMRNIVLLLQKLCMKHLCQIQKKKVSYERHFIFKLKSISISSLFINLTLCMPLKFQFLIYHLIGCQHKETKKLNIIINNSSFLTTICTLKNTSSNPFKISANAGDTSNDMMLLGTSIGFNLDQQSNGSHIYLPYHNGDSMVTRKC